MDSAMLDLFRPLAVHAGPAITLLNSQAQNMEVLSSECILLLSCS
jgi:hypothetical protein